MRVSRMMQTVLGEPLTLDEEETLAAILTQWAPQQLAELASLTKEYTKTESSDSSSKALAWNSLAAILAPDNGDNPLAHWVAAVQIRAQLVKGVMSAAAARTLLKKGNLAQAGEVNAGIRGTGRRDW